MNETSYTVAPEKEVEPITIESMWKLYTKEKLIPMIFKPTDEAVYVTPQVCDAIERHHEAICLHPELVDMPMISLHERDIACASCGKMLSIPRWNTECLADLIGLEFGSAWEKETERWCTCEKHRRARVGGPDDGMD